MTDPSVVWTRIVPLASVVAIATGQLLFKQAAVLMAGPAGYRSLPGIAVLGCALAIYGAATLAWIAALRQAPLSAVYPFMALSFIIVPVGSALLFKEKVGWGYGVGTGLLILGIVVITRFGEVSR